jgi:hypothetical protein
MIRITILGCIAANTEINIKITSMAESSTNNPEDDLFNIRSTLSNEHLLFAETLRNWRDPLLHGHEPLPILLCSRCVTCKCESLKDLRNYHHHIHEPYCPNFRHQCDRTKSLSKQNIQTKSKRRAISHDPSITVLNTSSSLSSSIMKSKSAEYSPLTNFVKRKKFTSKIPVRISTPSLSTSITLNNSSNKKTKIPRLILTHNLPSSTITTDDLYEIDR